VTFRDLVARPILLDSNLSVLLCVGLVGMAHIRAHKRLNGQYDETDFVLLRLVIERSRRLVVCPNVATETSNLVRQSGIGLRQAAAEMQRRLIKDAQEFYFESGLAVDDPDYLRLGVTDAVLLQLLAANQELVLLTVDLDLYLAGANRSLNVFNFNHIRNERADFG